MASSYILLKDANVVNEGSTYAASILIHNEYIEDIFLSSIPNNTIPQGTLIIDCTGKIVMPGVIDDQVHFREPGLTHKATIQSESKAALAGGITSFMEMPNVIPQTTTIQLLEEKIAIAEKTSFANHSFYIGATNSNIDQIKAIDTKITPGIKVFMGSSTGNMLVDNEESLQKIFSSAIVPIATHCEDECTIQHNLLHYKTLYDNSIPIEVHPLIRSSEACYISSSLAVKLALEHNTRLHLLHISTAQELSLLQAGKAADKQITAEVCVHHLWFSSDDYKSKGAFIKWNPAIKSREDRDALLEALNMNVLDVVATDHAPHTLEEKLQDYLQAPSGGPLVQHSLLAMLELHKQGLISLPLIVEKMCHAPADVFSVYKRGYLRKGYYADIVIVDLEKSTFIDNDSILYACKWSPFEGTVFSSSIDTTIINGNIAYSHGTVAPQSFAMQLQFSH